MYNLGWGHVQSGLYENSDEAWADFKLKSANLEQGWYLDETDKPQLNTIEFKKPVYFVIQHIYKVY